MDCLLGIVGVRGHNDGVHWPAAAQTGAQAGAPVAG